MLYNKTYRKYFDKNGLKNIFLPLQEIADSQTQSWILKSIEEINRFSNYIILISKYEQEPVDKFTISSIHESLAASSISIAFSIFNVFALITKTEATFFDDHIKDYFRRKTKLNSEETNLLSFRWQTPIHSINSLSYSNDEKLCVCKCDSLIYFRILNKKEPSLDTSLKNGKMIYSKEFFVIHLFYILSTIDLIASFLSEKSVKSKLNGTLQRNNYIEIENINAFMAISEDILPGL